MTLEQLRIFVAVADRGHVTRAAAALGITQSAASAAIAALEIPLPLASVQPGRPRDRIDRNRSAVPARGPCGARPRVGGEVGARRPCRIPDGCDLDCGKPHDRKLLAAAAARGIPCRQSRRSTRRRHSQYARSGKRRRRRRGAPRTGRGTDAASLARATASRHRPSPPGRGRGPPAVAA